MTRFFKPLYLFLPAAILAAGCSAGFASFPSPGGVPLQVQGKLDMKFNYPEKKPVRYAFIMSLTTMGEDRATETSEGVIHIINRGGFAGQFMQLRIRRQETRRKRVEVARRMQSIDTAIRDVFPPLSPNVIRQDPADIRFAFPVDPYGRFAVKEESPFHYMVYDYLCHFMPALDEQGAAVGDTWKAFVPVILGFRYASNEFTIAVDHKLEEILRLAGGHRAARISFEFSGRFDTAEDEYSVRFADAFRSENRIENSVSGRGEAVFDLDSGLLVWKTVSFTVRDARGREKIEDAGVRDGRKITRTVWDTKKTVHEVRESWRLLRENQALPVM